MFRIAMSGVFISVRSFFHAFRGYLDGDDLS